MDEFWKGLILGILIVIFLGFIFIFLDSGIPRKEPSCKAYLQDKLIDTRNNQGDIFASPTEITFEEMTLFEDDLFHYCGVEVKLQYNQNNEQLSNSMIYQNNSLTITKNFKEYFFTYYNGKICYIGIGENLDYWQGRWLE